MRCIFHIDMDAFFASIEVAKNPALKGKPVIVGGRPDRRGVVSTCSYEARLFGVHSAMPLSEAYRLCPNGIFLEGDYELYRKISSKIVDIFYIYTPYVEVVSIDEAYLDVTLCLDEIKAKALGKEIREKVFKETNLTCSIGIASNKLVAKIASSRSKPNGLLEVLPGAESEFLAPLPIQSLPGVGQKTQVLLNREGFSTIADLQASSLDELVRCHGTWGYHYFFAARGEDHRVVQWEEQPPKSIGAETTFEKDQIDCDFLAEELKKLVSKAHRRLRIHKMRTKRLTLKLRYSNFKTITRSLTLTTHVNELVFIQEEALNLFNNHYGGTQSLRLLGISLEQLTATYWQPTLFTI